MSYLNIDLLREYNFDPEDLSDEAELGDADVGVDDVDADTDPVAKGDDDWEEEEVDEEQF